MNRRDMITALIALGTCVPLAARAQDAKVRSIGIIFGTNEQQEKPVYEALLAGLRDYGYAPGKNITVYARYSESDLSRISVLADELIALKVDLVLTFDTPAAVLKQKNTTLPIVLFNSADPVAAGLVRSFARPGTNVTGMSAMWDQMIPKYIQLLLEIAPKMSRFALLYDDSIEPRVQEMHLQMARTTAQSRGLTITPVKWSKPSELGEAFDAIKKTRPEALLLVPTYKGFYFRRELAPQIRRLRIPSVGAITGGPVLEESGQLFGFGVAMVKQAHKSIRYVDQILKGANPAELAIEQYGIYRLAVNLPVARELGLKVPQSILMRADAVIE